MGQEVRSAEQDAKTGHSTRESFQEGPILDRIAGGAMLVEDVVVERHGQQFCRSGAYDLPVTSTRQFGSRAERHQYTARDKTTSRYLVGVHQL
jgi:hypothetical protein